MKKVKLMLVSLSILAVVGGALAFTVNNTATFCTAPYENGACPADCPDPNKLKATTEDQFVCTTVTIQNGIDLCHTAAEQTAQCGSTSFRSVVE